MTPVLNFSRGPINKRNNVKNGGRKMSILMMGAIGGWWGITRDQLYRSIKGSNDLEELVVALASPGGSVYDAYTIYSMIKSHRAKTTCYIIGECASAGTIIASAFDEVVSVPTAPFMIHQAATGQWGNKQQLRKAADTLEIHDEMILDVYKEKTKKPKQTLRRLMNAETWFTPRQAMAMGFVDRIEAQVELDYDAEFVGESDYYYWDSAQADSNQGRFDQRVAALAKDGIKAYEGRDLDEHTSKKSGRPMVTQIINYFKKGAYKILNKDGEEVELTELADQMESQISEDVDAEVRKHIMNLLPDMQETVADLVASRLSENEDILNAVKATVPDEVKAAFDKQASGLRKEIANVKNGKRTPTVVDDKAQGRVIGKEGEGDDEGDVSPAELKFIDDLLNSGSITEKEAKKLRESKAKASA